ncbi:MAG: hypothetical protein Q9222_006241 [Ikaeria aurantiellina]
MMPLTTFAPATGSSHEQVPIGKPRVTQKRKKRDLEYGPDTLGGFDSPSTVSLSPGIYRQYRTAGQPFNRPVHPYPFPHAPASSRLKATAPHPSTGSLLSLDPDSEPLTESSSQDEAEEAGRVSQPRAAKPGLRQQHYAVLTSLLHRCLLDKDYMRASRAWAMLLRTEVNGHPLDIRTQDRWGIGAEILLHLDASSVNQASVDADQATQTRGKGGKSGTHFTQSNLMKAKDYYERLILQYPYRKTSSGSISSLHFYPVMFGIWIYSIQLSYRVALHQSSDHYERPNSAGHSTDTTEEDLRSKSSASQSQFEVTARQTAIREARRITERLDELLSSPPYSDHSGLWKIQGMLYLWIGHLQDCHPSPEYSETESVGSADSLNSSYSETGSSKPTVGSRRADRKHTADADDMIHAKQAFSQALKLGGSMDLRTRELVGF